MREWLRQLAQAGHTTAATTATPSWWGWPVRLWRSLARRLGAYDYSHEVHEAMAGCLACKACATQCPLEVDIPAFRAEFLHRYHRRYARPLTDLLVGALEHLLPWMAAAPRLWNLMLRNPVSAWKLRTLAGLTDLPPLSVPSARSALRARGIRPRGPRALATLDSATRDKTVVVVQDAFTSFYDTSVLAAAVDVLRGMGRHVEVLPYFPSGKGLHVRGFLGRFGRLVGRNVKTLAEVAALEIPLVALEPAVALAFRDEYPKALPDGHAMPRVHLLQEWLADHRELLPTVSDAQGEAHHLLAHCTERALEPGSTARWAEVFSAAGLALEIERVGCCGMSGAYGHELAHQAESRGIFEMSWRHHLPDDPSRAVATGHSCRHQVHRLADVEVRHPVEVLAEAITRSDPRHLMD